MVKSGNITPFMMRIKVTDIFFIHCSYSFDEKSGIWDVGVNNYGQQKRGGDPFTRRPAPHWVKRPLNWILAGLIPYH